MKREGGKTTLTVVGTDLSIDNTTGVLTAARYYTWQGLTVGVRTGNTTPCSGRSSPTTKAPSTT